MTRLLPVLLFSFILAGCVSSRSRSPQEYEALRDNIASLHASSKFGPDDPRLFDPKMIDEYPPQFAKLYCGDLSPSSCIKEFNQNVFSKLAQRYFAADRFSVQSTCAEEPLICGDLNTLETLFVRLHNRSIEQSEREKLNLIEDWRKGKITDEELKSALRMEFKFENGRLLMSLPPV